MEGESRLSDSAQMRQPDARQLAFLFTDLVNSTGLKSQLNAWNYVCRILEPHDEIFRDLLKDYAGAHEIKHLGDGFLAIFDDVRDAIAFSLRFQAAIRDFPWQLETPEQQVLSRVGIDTGFAVIKTDGEIPVDVFGPSVDLASRVMSAADGGRILMTSTAYELARPAAAFIEMNLRQAGLPDPGVQLVRHGEYRIQGVAEPVVLCEACAHCQTPTAPRSNPPKVINIADEWWQPEPVANNFNSSDVPDRPGWKIVRKLGEGGFGAAYLGQEGKDATNERVFKFCRSLDRLDSLKNELQLLQHLRRLNRNDIVNYLGSHLDRPPYFLEFEYVPGGNLHDWCQQQGGLNQIDLETRLDLFAQIAAAVAAAHRERVFHLDLKPSNILMDRDAEGRWRPKITDFGIGAIERNGEITRLSSRKSSHTPLGSSTSSRDHSATAARHLYSPPEQDFNGNTGLASVPTAASLDIRDVYALGVLLFQFAVGDLQRPLSPSAIRQVTPRLLRDDIEQATHFDPQQRLSSAAELESRVRHLKGRERRRFLVKSFVPVAGSLAVGLMAATGISFMIYGLYSATLEAKREADIAREEADDARHQVEQQYQGKLKAITGVWKDVDGGEDLSLRRSLPNEVQQVQLLREIRIWLLEQAEQDLARLPAERNDLETQISYARLMLRISELLDDEKLDAREKRLKSGQAVLQPALLSHPDHPGLRLLLSDLENQLGQIANERKDPGALQYFERCLKIRQQLLSDARQSKTPFPLPLWEYERKWLASQHNLGLIKLELANKPREGQKSLDTLSAEAEGHAAIVLLQESLDGRAKLAASVQPSSAALMRDLGSSQFTFGLIFRDRANKEYAAKRSTEAQEWVQLAREFYGQALKSFQSSQQIETSAITRQRLVESLRELVDLELEQGASEAAAGFRDDMIQQVAQVLPSSVRDLHARVYFTDAQFSLHKYRLDHRPEDLPIAKADLRLAEHLFLTLVNLEPSNLRYLGDLAVVQHDLGELLVGSTDPRERNDAAEQFRKALSNWDLVKQKAADQFERLYLSSYQNAEARLLSLKGPPAPTSPPGL